MTTRQSAPESPPRSEDASNEPTLSRRALLGGSTAVLAGLAGCTGPNAEVVVGKDDESRSTYDVSSGSLRVDVEYGHVTVTETDGDAVSVRTKKSGSLLASLSAVDIASRRDGDTVVVEGSYESGGFLSSAPSVDVRIDVPSGVAVEEMSVTNGDAVVDGASIASGLTVRTENGDAVAKRVDDDVGAETTNGDAVVERVAGFVTARSENGDATIRRCDGVDGAETTNGDVTAEVPAIREETTLSSVNGDVTARLGDELDATVVAVTENGDVSASDSSLSTETNTDAYVEGTVGDGTDELRVETTNGDVTVTDLA